VAVPAATRHEGIDRMKKSQGICDFFISVVGFSTKQFGKIGRMVNRPQERPPKAISKNLEAAGNITSPEQPDEKRLEKLLISMYQNY
jgi:hypothetical protein